MTRNDSYLPARAAMVDEQIKARGISDERVLAAMRRVPREKFVPETVQNLAYANGPLPIGHGQTISQPYIVALMSASLELNETDTVLEVGTGCGYAAAVLSLACAQVYTIECIDALAADARQRLKELGFDNVTVFAGDGSLGWPANAPYTAIVTAAAGPCVPEALKQQLAIGGRLVMPVGKRGLYQTLIRLRRTGESQFDREDLCDVRFVPLIGAEGFDPGSPATDNGVVH